jgi:hypothetical protein
MNSSPARGQGLTLNRVAMLAVSSLVLSSCASVLSPDPKDLPDCEFQQSNELCGQPRLRPVDPYLPYSRSD